VVTSNCIARNSGGHARAEHHRHQPGFAGARRREPRGAHAPAPPAQVPRDHPARRLPRLLQEIDSTRRSRMHYRTAVLFPSYSSSFSCCSLFWFLSRLEVNWAQYKFFDEFIMPTVSNKCTEREDLLPKVNCIRKLQ